MSLCPRLKKNQPRPPTPTAAGYRFTPVAAPNSRKWPKHPNNGLVILPNGRMLTQNPALPRLPGQVRLQGKHPVNLADIAGAGTENQVPLPIGLGEQQFFDGAELELEQIELWPSECSKASVQLVHSGLFPCSPIFLTLAIDIRVLDFVWRLFLRIAPNYTAWCSAATDFLGAQGYHLPGNDPLRRHFANALLQWFMLLVDMTSARINSILHGVRADLVPGSSVTGTYRSPAEHCGETPKVTEEPSEYLRTCCPLCFGGSCKDAVVNADACFTQKHSAKGGRDPPRVHPNTFFIPEEETNAWRQYVDSVRPKRNGEHSWKCQKTDDNSQEQANHLEGGLRVPKSVLDGCLASFTAADEARIKGSTQFFNVTANMTLLCRHDHPLFSMNMKTAGEGQHYVLALLGKLFEHLPPDFFVQLLYDIGCQLHRSCNKCGFLKSYMNHMTFAVSIFHAFGHQWPCQIVYHPRKCLGYGLCDGEGAERLWHALSHLIAYGRVAGYYVRMYNLDCQFNFNNKENLFKLGTWLRRKTYEAEETLGECGFPEDVLRREWEAQVKAQTKPLPCQTKNQGKSAVEEAIQLRKSWDTAQAHVDELRRRIIDVSSEHWESATAELELDTALTALTKARAKVTKKESAMGVTARQQLHHLLKSPFLGKKMNAGALKTCIQERLRGRKFELDCLERSYQKQRSEQRINEHTQDSVKRRDPAIADLACRYNKLCNDMHRLIQQKKAPRNSVAPLKIEMEGLFDLDVDDDIWLDIGLGYEEQDDTIPPLWLSNDHVRTGICALLDRDRYREDWARIVGERNAMQECVVGVPNGDNLPEWGPLEDEIRMHQAVHILGSGVEAIEETGFNYNVEFEQEADGLLVEHLDSLTISENYRDQQSNLSL
ncbi:hypothetical protein BDP27DRAFT_1382877 [Rhodocollybia butyracea]|uniref:CxC2-like cysteine cluster KDZ transposase-associated domain-containing protein n=1 Tax=Rhodocollybia butyracea TaxID=206335 RepID=A0A9P5U8S2_9AGAR|nr:hypothetical protein BDP27DRAFT_1382877 [Rhodocollybia butyracea]